MSETLKAHPVKIDDGEQTQHPALLFEFAAKCCMIRSFRDIGRKDIDRNERHHQHTKDAEDDFQEDFRSQIVNSNT